MTLEHARETAEALTAIGIPTGVVHGNLTAALRGDTLARFRVGELRAVCNVHVLTEGWDDPGCEVCILTRRPQHAGTYLQMIGRVLRPSAGKRDALVLDLCGSVHEHGTPDCERIYSLDGEGITKTERQPIRQCPTCGSVFLVAAGDSCPACGCELPRREVGLPSIVGGELSEVPTLPARPMPTISITSKYPGKCRLCHGRIEIGDRIFWSKGTKPRHAICDTAAALTEADRLLAAAGS